MCMNLPVLLQVASPHVSCMPRDEPSFSLLFNLRRRGLPMDVSLASGYLPFLPKGPKIDLPAIWGAMRGVRSNMASVDDVAFQILAAFPGCGVQAMLHYLRLLAAVPATLSNQVLQLGIFKSGSVSIFQSCRPIKLASAPNAVSAGVVHKEVTFRSEIDSSWSRTLYSYRNELCPRFLSLSSHATVSLALYSCGEAHIVEGDESSAFDTPVRSDVASLSSAWPSQCGFGA